MNATRVKSGRRLRFFLATTLALGAAVPIWASSCPSIAKPSQVTITDGSLVSAGAARRLDVPTNRITEILNGPRAITGDTALRLARFFGTTSEFWLNLRSLYELRVAQKKAGKSIDPLPALKHFEEAHA